MLSLKPGLMSYNRMGFYRFVTGDPGGGIALMKEAVNAAAKYPENKAWCLVELGNIYFKTSRWAEAETAYRDAIAVFHDSHAGYAGLASVQAARGKYLEAIESYKHAQSITPMLQYAGALYDLYAATGKKVEAKQEAEMVDVAAKLEEAANQKANRTLALIFANQDRNLDRALKLAQADFEIRQDVYTYDILAWTLTKNRHFEEAKKASEEALKLGAPEASFFYHAGMNASALDDTAGARKYLTKALELNAGFDIRQAAIARETLDKLQADSK